MTAPAESTNDTASIAKDDADFYRYYRGRIKDLCADIHTAHESANHYQSLGNSLATQPVTTPILFPAEDYSVGNIGAESSNRRAPVGPHNQSQLELTLRDAARQAYVFAGHYRRVHGELSAALQAQVSLTSDPACAVLTLDETGQLGYNRASDEWTAGSVDLGDRLSGAAYRLQESGLLPKFDEFFTPVAKDDDEQCPTCAEHGREHCWTHGDPRIELGTRVTAPAEAAPGGTVTGVLIENERINGLGLAAIQSDDDPWPYAVLASTVRPVETETAAR
ncbi:hypothetical protein NQK81_13410 [Amycolatopsis roodepoortensis]|uniref:hypothetical protein n=1 Tax=Amycolatopsis roodepoortensis TaxID=700274 RepID=UPI00214B44DD|nr:hypothetical protein [Amycolatopsis roodepoortensis]UUV34403.1 hypothetical protein NQK81_13410 [Amycolatopsis roodepoortensis]